MKRTYLLFLVFFALIPTLVWGQIKITGQVKDASTQIPLIGVNVYVKGTVAGTITDTNGNFSLTVKSNTALSLIFSYVGYKSQTKEVTKSSKVDVVLEEEPIQGQEVVVAASRIEESTLKSPVSIEKMDIRQIQASASPSFYDGLRNLKGIDMGTQSMAFNSVNMRGFGGNGNTRVVQLVDGMDNQAPGLNFAVGNLVGLSELDAESVEVLPGAASALYGPNAISGLLLMTSKSPFLYQGLSVSLKGGIMNASNRENPTTPFYDMSVRWAKSFNNKLALKFNVSYLQAQDWQATNYRDQSFANGKAGLSEGNYGTNPGYNGVNIYGDENSTGFNLNTNLLPAFLQLRGVYAANPSSPLVPASLVPLIQGYNQIVGLGVPGSVLNGLLFPNTNVARTGYAERDLVDYTVKNLKLNAAVHYRFSDKVEGIAQVNWGQGTTVYTSSDRYYLDNLYMGQYKLELKGDNFFLRGYTSQENSGDTYATGILASLVNESWKPSTTWYQTYGFGYAGQALQGFGTALQAALGAGQAPATAIGTATTAVNNASATIHNGVRNAADVGRLVPGSAAFAAAFNTIKNSAIPNGAKFLDRTALWHYEGMYNFKNLIDPKNIEIVMGANYRIYSLDSQGTLFLKDANGKEFSIAEYGMYAQLIKNFGEKLRLTGAIRYDKNENFEGQFSPRVSAVISPTPDQNFRLSYQTGFRIPSTQNQYINLITPVSYLMGGLKVQQDQLGLNSSNTVFVNNGQPFNFPTYKPERVISYELGYKGLVNKRLMIDFSYYNSTLKDMGTGVIVRSTSTLLRDAVAKNPSTVATNSATLPLRIVTNYTGEVDFHGFNLGLDYYADGGYVFSGSVSNNTLRNGLNKDFGAIFSNDLNDNILSDRTVTFYNTPKFKYIFGVANRNISKSGWGFTVNYRYQQAVAWLDLISPTSAQIGENHRQLVVPAFGTIDASISKKINSIKSILKIGGTNLSGNLYQTGLGNPYIGTTIFVGITFDELLNK